MNSSDWKRVVVVIMRRAKTRKLVITSDDLVDLDPGTVLNVTKCSRTGNVEIVMQPRPVLIEGTVTR